MWMGTCYRDLLLKRFKFALKGENALEVGCHDGFLLANVEAKKKVGIDLEPVNAYAGIEYIKSDFLNYNFGNEKFDIILSIEVLEHVKEPEKFLQAVNKLISNEGKVLLSVPSKNIKIFPYLFQPYLDRRWGHHYRRGFSAKELHQLLEENFPGRDYKILCWNCPFWRTAYLPLKMLWEISPGATKKILKLSIKLDSKFRQGKNGFFFVIIY